MLYSSVRLQLLVFPSTSMALLLGLFFFFFFAGSSSFLITLIWECPGSTVFLLLSNFFPGCSHLPHAFSDISTCIPMLIARAIYKAIHGNDLSVHQQRDGWRRYIYACSVASVMSNSLRPYGLYRLPGSPVQRILQARILKWGTMSSSRASSWPRDQIHVSCIADGFFTAEPQGSLVCCSP